MWVVQTLRTGHLLFAFSLVETSGSPMKIISALDLIRTVRRFDDRTASRGNCIAYGYRALGVDNKRNRRAPRRQGHADGARLLVGVLESAQLFDRVSHERAGQV